MIDENMYRQIMNRTAPSAALIQKTKANMKRKGLIIMKREKAHGMRRTFSAAVIAVMIAMLCTAAAFAAWNFMKPSEVADQFGYHALSAAFDSDSAININKSVTSGDYTFTLLAVVTGKDIADMPYSDADISDERVYAVVAIQNADGSPMPESADPAFLATPLIRGLTPWQYNAVTMHGGYSETAVDGVLYRVVDCDDVSMFADRGLYFAVCTEMFINNKIFAMDDQSGIISIAADYTGAAALFDLPIDASLADPAKAERYLRNQNAGGGTNEEERPPDAADTSGGEITFTESEPQLISG